MDARTLQHVGRHADLTPRLVVDALTFAVLCGHDDKSFFQGGHVVLGVGVGGLDTLLEIATLLNQVHALQGIGLGDAGLDGFQSLAERLGRNLSPPPRPVLLEGHEVATDRIPLTTTGSERTFVLVAKRGFALSFAGRHDTIIAGIGPLCKAPPLKADPIEQWSSSGAATRLVFSEGLGG